jgi:NAD(P)-dependent dehydrogenase (short-subunit alcohol dehydrogenase family)
MTSETAMSGRLAGRHAVITGAGRGIGSAIARAYAAEGADVVLAARTESEIVSVAAQINEGDGGKAVAVVCDLTDGDQVAALVGSAREAVGTIDVLVNNAGTTKIGRFLDASVDDFSRVMDVNFLGVVRLTQAVAPQMVAAGRGKIINVASTAGKYGSVLQSPYNASKHAVVGLTRCLALELARSGVTANAICPGFVDTPLIENAIGPFAAAAGVEERAVLPMLLDRVPLGRLLEPEEVAHLAVYLGSAESDAMTGQALTISGGLILV